MYSKPTFVWYKNYVAIDSVRDGYEISTNYLKSYLTLHKDLSKNSEALYSAIPSAVEHAHNMEQRSCEARETNAHAFETIEISPYAMVITPTISF